MLNQSPDRRQPARWILTIGAVLLLLQGVTRAADLTPEQQLEKKWASAARKVAREHIKLAKWCDRQDLYKYGFLEWGDAMELDPDNDDARERLGYLKNAVGTWIRSRTIEVKQVDEIDEDDRVKLMDHYKAERLDIKDKALKEFEKVLKLAVKLLNEDWQQKVARYILRYDPKNPGALALQGKELGEDGDRPVEPPVPESPEQPGGREVPTRFEGRGAPRALDLPAAVPDGKHTWIEKSGLPLKWAESRHHCVMGTEMGEERMQEICKVLEQTRARFYMRYFVPNEQEFYPRKMVIMYLDTEEEHKQFCDRVYQEDAYNEAAFSFTRDRSGGATYPKYFGAWCHSEGEAVEKDFAVHYATHLITNALNLPTWLEEALAYEQSIGLLGTSWTSCINDEATGERGKDWADPVNWKELIRGVVRLEEDTPITSIIGFKPNEIDPKIAAKCWSMLCYLLEKYPDKVYGFLGACVPGPFEVQDQAFRAYFGKGMEEIEADWREYVKATY